jgi:serine O-acetyltransferase
MLMADVERQYRVRGRSDAPEGAWAVVRELGNHRFHPVVLIRLSLWFAEQGTRTGRGLAKVVSFSNSVLYGVEVALQSRIGPGLYLPHAGGIVLGASSIGANATIFQGVTLGASELDLEFDPSRRPTVGDDVTIAAGAKVIGGVRVGDRATVGANAVVVRDVPAGDVVGGVPSRSLSSGEHPTETAAKGATS